jgi:hypothetical protein
MKILADPAVKQEIITRLRKVGPNNKRQWGRMTSHQMLCHLSDSFKGVIGEKPLGRKSNIISRSLIKWIALKAPITWPHGVKTMPEMDQAIGGTPPAEFDSDRQDLEALIGRITSANRDFQWTQHPAFGPLSEWEWQRWAFLHVDHHLRQFGA